MPNHQKTPWMVLILIVFSACRPAPLPAPADRGSPSASPTSPPLPTIPIPSATTLLSDEPLPGAPGLGDAYFPSLGNGGYDVLEYHLELDVDLERRFISGAATISARSIQYLSSFNLDFLGLAISSLSVDQIPAQFSRQEAELTVFPAAPIPAGDAFTIEISYSGEPGKNLPPELEEYEIGWNFYPGGVMVAGEPSGSSAWYPVNEHPSDKALYSFAVTVSEPYQVAANGLLTSIEDHGDTRTFFWESSYPISSYLVTVAIGEFDLDSRETRSGIPVRNYFGVGVPQHVRADFSQIPEVIDFYSAIFGPYPFEAVGVVVHDLDIGFALETQTLIVFGRGFTNEIVVAHELAHQWYGDSVGPATWQDVWLNEGFATYASMLWLEELYGTEAMQNELSEYYAGIALGEPILPLTSSELSSRLARYRLDSNDLSASTVSRALDLLFDSLLAPAELDQIISLVPSAGMTANAFPRFVNGTYRGTLDFPLSNIYACLETLGHPEYTPEQAFYPAPGDPSPDKMFSRSVYHRGALTLHALRLELGDEVFFTILRRFAEIYAYSSAKTSDFISLAESVSGRELHDFFQAWLYAPNIPDLPAMGLYRSQFTSQ